MSIHYEDSRVTLHHGDCLDVLRTLPDASVDAVVCDPPYGLGFMGKAWDSPDKSASTRPRADGDHTANPFKRARAEYGGASYGGDHAREMVTFQQWCEEWAAECLRVLKPGGHLLAFGGTRTWHRLACAVEDAGFEVRDSIAWLYGSGFPKSLDVSKAIDKARVEDREPRVRVTSWVADECARLGWTRTMLCEAFGVKNQPIQGWTERNMAYAVIPTWENWQRLKALVGFGDDMDAEVWRLNGRKGSPGAAWDSREVLGHVDDRRGDGTVIGLRHSGELNRATSNAAREWAGWGTALKPAFEPVVVARKPLVGTVAANVTTHGTGALNIDGCRIDTHVVGHRTNGSANEVYGDLSYTAGQRWEGSPAGRWPANVILDEDQAAALDEQSGTLTSGKMKPTHTTAGTNGRASCYGKDAAGGFTTMETYGDSGGASRFFKVAEADDGDHLDECPDCQWEAEQPDLPIEHLEARFRYFPKAPKKERPVVDGVAHPTVKPLALMRWLVRLVTPPGGTVLEPFAGSGTTVEACLVEGFQCIAIEKGDEYLPLIVERIRRQTEPPEVEHLTRHTDPEAAIVEQVREMSLFELDGEGA